ncbi:hypothetical protein Scep_015705 [Stephania cephalantha]|uniref:Rab-GAP TBC domain-containing protein n=1 Tax=Stephania cephalantha TaxID=152367 RepID=A0AAP0J3P6_9MAGN
MRGKKSADLLKVDYNSVKRDAYGFTVRPQHLNRYREHANIYKEEEEERSERWMSFLERQAESALIPVNGISYPEATIREEVAGLEKDVELNGSSDGRNSPSAGSTEDISEKGVRAGSKERKSHEVQIWSQIRPSLATIEYMLSFRMRKQKHLGKDEKSIIDGSHHSVIEEVILSKGVSDEESEDEFYDVEKSDAVRDIPSNGHLPALDDGFFPENLLSWKEELECLVRGGVPMALRGELWQVFVGVRTCRVDGYYQALLHQESNAAHEQTRDSSISNDTSKESSLSHECLAEKWKGQIEKDLPRTFPGHPALDEDGRNALRRLLTAYARHNPSVGYCQAMNFFAGLLLLLMPEENAFWTLTGLMDSYFDGYYSEEMIESQVDQLVFEELIRERFPKLVNHLDYLGVQVGWVTGPWFLSIFVNMLPWESVLRVWDVLLFEGNRVMLFRTACALMELYGPTLVTTKDAGDAVTLLQSLAGSTFDSSQLVLTACMGYQAVTEARLRESRDKHRPLVRSVIEERSKGLNAWKDTQGLASKLYSLKQDHGTVKSEASATELSGMQRNGDAPLLESECADLEFFGSIKGIWL